MSKLCDVWSAVRNVGVSLIMSFWGRIPAVLEILKLEIILWDLEHYGHFCRQSISSFLGFVKSLSQHLKKYVFRRNCANHRGHKDWGSQVLEPYYVIDLCKQCILLFVNV